MRAKPPTIFVSSSRDMAEWAAFATAHIRDFAARHGLTDLHIFDYRDIDPAALDHSATWQDNLLAPSQMDAALTLVLLGERIGTPLPPTFRLKEDISERLRSAGFDWVQVPGTIASSLLPGQVPLTGVLFEFFDAFLPRADGSRSGSLRVIFKGKPDATGEPDFGNGDFRLQIESSLDSPQRKRQLRKEYDEQLDWLNLFWCKLYGLRQHASEFCSNQDRFRDYLESTLNAEFLGQNFGADGFSKARVDPRRVTLPGPASYDLERASFFLGRGPQIAELSRRALQNDEPRRLVPVIGESGTGKSSLLRAGLLNDALSPARRRLGWRSAFLSLSERPADQGPILFLAAAVAQPNALPELGPLEALIQRLNGQRPIEAAERLLNILAEMEFANIGRLKRPKLLLVVDQLELAIDGARLEEPALASEWNAFLHLLAALGNALLDPQMSKVLEPPAQRISGLLPCTVILGLPTDRLEALSRVVQPGDHVFPLPRLVDETALRQVITGTFSALGLKVEPSACEALCW